MPTTVCVPAIRVEDQFERHLDVTFDAPQISSDGGLVLLRMLDRKRGITSALSEAIADQRDPSKVSHPHEALVRQRVLQIAMGYEDAVDANYLRNDPLLQLVCDRDVPLASQPTFSRLESNPSGRDAVRAQRALEKRWVAGLPAGLSRLVLDIDGTDDPTHGQQQFSFYNSHHGSTIYAPLLVFDQFGALASARLRSGKHHLAHFAAPMLARLIRLVRARLPRVRILIRADAAFGVTRVIRPLEALRAELGRIDYVLGVSPNAAIRRCAKTIVDEVTAKAAQSREGSATAFDDWHYHSEAWPAPRRTIIKASSLEGRVDIRCVVTTIAEGSPESIYADLYAKRGDSENRIKDFKRALHADRLSCSLYFANALRLQFHAAAYMLCHEMRAIAETQVERAIEREQPGKSEPRPQLDTLRIRLLKVAAIVRRSARRVWISLPRAFPEARRFRAIAAALS